MNTLTFTNVPAAKITTMLAALQANHDVTVSPNVTPNPDGTYSIEGSGIKADALYDGSSEVLTVQVLQHPDVPFAMTIIKHKIQAALA